MRAIEPETLDRWRGLVVVDRDGTSVGAIREFYLDRETGQPTWALIDSGLLSSKRTFVPLVDVTESAGALRVPYGKQQVRTAPEIHLDGQLTAEEEALLFAHYGMDYPAASSAPGPVGEKPVDEHGRAAPPGA